MITLTPHRRIHVPNKAALLAALLLVAASWFAMPGDAANGSEHGRQDVVSIAKGNDSAPDATSKRTRKLSISLLLFGNG